MGGRTHQQLIFLFLIWNLNLKMVFLPHKNSKLDGSVRETVALSCARGARQTLCRAFFVGTHGKGHTVAFCTVKPLCRAPRLTTHGK
jgi:hypothetical protein